MLKYLASNRGMFVKKDDDRQGKPMAPTVFALSHDKVHQSNGLLASTWTANGLYVKLGAAVASNSTTVTEGDAQGM